MTKKAPYKGLGAESGVKHEPVSEIDTAAVDSLKGLDPKRPIREADMSLSSTIASEPRFNRPIRDLAPCDRIATTFEFQVYLPTAAFFSGASRSRIRFC